MITTALLTVGGLAALLAAVINSRPAEFRISRSVVIDAPPSAAFGQVNDLRRWQEMSPYAKLDPNAQYSYTGPQSGPGASLAWVGNREAGQGVMTVVESIPDQLVRMRLEFLKPFKAANTVEFTFQPEADHTRVTWSMSGRSGFMCKAFGMFMNMDKMCGSQFEEGLANMKRIAEASPESTVLDVARAR